MTLAQQLRREPSVRQIATRIVNECLRIQPDEQVAIYSSDHTLDYATALALEVEKTGGVSNTFVETDEFFWAYAKDVPETQYQRKQKAFLSLLEQTNASISLSGPRDPSLFKTVPSERFTKMAEGEREIGEKTRERKIRTLSLPVGLITPERAKIYGFDYDHWRNDFNNSLDVDHAKISTVAQKIGSRLERARNVRVTSSNGTNLSFALKDRPIHVHDGIIDESDLDAETYFETLPSGALELVPDEDSAQGTVIFDQPTALAGKMLQGLRWEFEDGHLQKYNATGNLDSFKSIYDAATGDKDKLAVWAIGLNPNAGLIGFFTDRLVQGTTSIGIGGNKLNGGNNDSPFGFEQTLRKPTVEIDGYRLINDGRIQP